MKTKDVKLYDSTLILGKGFEMTQKLGESLKRELKVHLTLSCHLQPLKITIAI
jgi:hypothetical protein